MGAIDLKKVLSVDAVDVSEKIFESKNELFLHMSNMLKKSGYIENVDKFMKALYERESLGSTYMEDPLVLPHGKSGCVISPGVAFCRFKPMVYDKEDERLAKMAIMLAIPKNTESNEYLGLLAKISCSLLDEDIKRLLMEETDANKIVLEMSKKIQV